MSGDEMSVHPRDSTQLVMHLPPPIVLYCVSWRARGVAVTIAIVLARSFDATLLLVSVP